MENSLTIIIENAIAVAASSIQVVLLILILLGNNAKRNSMLYTVGWMIANVLTLVIFSAITLHTFSSNSNSSNYLKLFMGLFLIIFGVYQGYQYFSKKEKKAKKTPKWLDKIDNLSGKSSILLGFLLCVISPKDIIILMESGLAISIYSNVLLEKISIIILFTLIASSTMILPTLIYFIFGSKLSKLLKKIKNWLIIHNKIILSIVFIILGIATLQKK